MQTADTDLVIIGAGLAGFCAALTAQNSIGRIIMLSKGELFATGSSFRNLNGRWGITYAVTAQEQEHLFATINTIARGTNDQILSKILVEESHCAFLRLKDWGVQFAHHPDVGLLRVRPCFAEIPLAAIILEAQQCATSLHRRLDRNVVTCLAQTRAQSIETNQAGTICVIAESKGNPIRIKARAAIIATGGNGATFQHHVVDPGLTGDGYTILQALGVPLKNMEYTQTVWEDIMPGPQQRFPQDAFFDGKHLFKNAQGETITLPAPDSALAQSRRQHVPISNLQDDRRFDNLLRSHLGAGRHPLAPIFVHEVNDPSPRYKILPHAMASNGGVAISEWGETGMEGIFAAGEVTTGMHGGDRVGGTMISSCLVFGQRAALRAIQYING